MADHLNPEALDQQALEAAAKAIAGKHWLTALDDARAAVSAFLAALPAPRTITTMEELEAMPVGAVVYAANHIGPAERFTVGWMGCGSAAAWSSAVLARDGLPARVLWVPTEGGGE